jgi:hypothetical protein
MDPQHIHTAAVLWMRASSIGINDRGLSGDFLDYILPFGGEPIVQEKYGRGKENNEQMIIMKVRGLFGS